MLVLLVFFAGSCKSSEPADPPAPEPVYSYSAHAPYYQAVEPARHYSNIILDGALVYTVQSGDILSEIAKHFYQDGTYYPLIMMVSDAVRDPDEIEPGMVLTVPDLRINMIDARARNSMNSFFGRIANIEDQRGRHKTAGLIRNRTI
jgi:hypothetical protein